MTINIILIILLSLIIVLYIVNINKKNKRIKEIETIKKEEIKNIFKESWDKEEKDFNLKKSELFLKERVIKNKITQLEIFFKEKENQYKTINQDLEFYREGKIEEIDNSAEEYKKHKQSLIDISIDQYRERRTDLYNIELNMMAKDRLILQNELAEIKEAIEVERRKRAAINEEIRRAREAEEQQETGYLPVRISPEPADHHELQRLRSRI